MKKIFSFLLFCIPLISFSQNSVTIDGTAESSNGDSVIIINDTHYLGKKVETYTSITKENKFNFSFSLDRNRIVVLKYKGNENFIYVEPNTSFSIKISTAGVPDFEGKGAVNNQFLQKFNSQFKLDFDKTEMEKKILETGIDGFEIALFDSKQKQTKFYNDYTDKSLLSDDFKKYIQKRISYNYWYWLLSYPAVNANTSKAKTVNAIPAIILEPLDRNNVVDEFAMICDSYRGFVNAFITYFNSEANGFNTFHDFNTAVDRKCTFAKNKLSGEPYSYFVCKQLLEYCEKMTPSFAKEIFKTFETLDKKGVYSSIAKEKCGDWMETKDPKKETVQETAASGYKPSKDNAEPKFKDVKGNDVSLSKLEGKVLYVDFWASWCGPCRQQFPYSKELHKKLNDKQKKQIEFIYISIDDDETRWKKGIEDNELDNGIMLLSPGGWKSDACKYFQINSIPRYIIIDKKGNIVNINAPRPSDENILNELLNLLK